VCRMRISDTFGRRKPNSRERLPIASTWAEVPRPHLIYLLRIPDVHLKAQIINDQSGFPCHPGSKKYDNSGEGQKNNIWHIRVAGSPGRTNWTRKSPGISSVRSIVASEGNSGFPKGHLGNGVFQCRDGVLAGARMRIPT